jgi:hypothetical protein
MKYFKCVDSGDGSADWTAAGNWFSDAACTIPTSAAVTGVDGVTMVSSTAVSVIVPVITLTDFVCTIAFSVDSTNLTIDGGVLDWSCGTQWLGDASDATSSTFTGVGNDCLGIASATTAIFDDGALVMANQTTTTTYLRRGSGNVAVITGDVVLDQEGGYPTYNSGEGSVTGNVIVRDGGYLVTIVATMVTGAIKIYNTLGPGDFYGGGGLVEFYAQPANSASYMETTIRPMVKGLVISAGSASAPFGMDLTQLKIPAAAEVITGKYVTTASSNSVQGTVDVAAAVAGQLVTDTAAVNAAKAFIIRPADGGPANVLGVVGTFNDTTDDAAAVTTEIQYLKPGLRSGTNTLKPSLLTAEGQLKPGLVGD